MKPVFITGMVLGCLGFGLAQGVQGNVRLGGKATIATTGHSATLTWNASQNATSYNIYRSTTHGGPYSKVASGIAGTTYTDVQVNHTQTLYYVTTALSGTNETGYSNETVAVIP